MEAKQPKKMPEPTQQKEARRDMSVRQFWELFKEEMDKSTEEIKEFNKTLLKQINEE